MKLKIVMRILESVVLVRDNALSLLGQMLVSIKVSEINTVLWHPEYGGYPTK